MKKLMQGFVAALFLLGSVSPGVADGSHGAGYFPNLPVMDQDGKSYTFYDDLIKGKTVVVNFIYTHCPDLCPLTTARMSQLQTSLGDKLGRDVFFYSITVDPKRDTPEELKKFADAFGAKNGWRFLTGDPESIKKINHALGDRSRKLSEHRNEIVIGNDATGVWARNSLMGDLASVEMEIRGMDPGWRPGGRETGNQNLVDKVYDSGSVPGKAMFTKLCAPCHAVGGDPRVGPDLADVTKRRPRGWLLEFIMFPDLMRQRNDPETMALLKKYPGAMMPKLGLTTQDATDILDYLDKLSLQAKSPKPSVN